LAFRALVLIGKAVTNEKTGIPGELQQVAVFIRDDAYGRRDPAVLASRYSPPARGWIALAVLNLPSPLTYVCEVDGSDGRGVVSRWLDDSGFQAAARTGAAGHCWPAHWSPRPRTARAGNRESRRP